MQIFCQLRRFSENSLQKDIIFTFLSFSNCIYKNDKSLIKIFVKSIKKRAKDRFVLIPICGIGLKAKKYNLQ